MTSNQRIEDAGIKIMYSGMDLISKVLFIRFINFHQISYFGPVVVVASLALVPTYFTMSSL